MHRTPEQLLTEILDAFSLKWDVTAEETYDSGEGATAAITINGEDFAVEVWRR